MALFITLLSCEKVVVKVFVCFFNVTLKKGSSLTRSTPLKAVSTAKEKRVEFLRFPELASNNLTRFVCSGVRGGLAPIVLPLFQGILVVIVLCFLSF